MTTTDVLVIGAGPTGLTAANVLAHSGVKFRIIDKAPGPVEETRAIGVQAKTLELLDKFGLGGRVADEGLKTGAFELFDEGRPVGRLPFLKDGGDDRTPYPFLLILEQSKTERLLTQNLEKSGNEVEWSTELLRLAQTPDGVRAAVRTPGGSEETIEAAWVVGADGASSPVRHSLDLGFEGDTYEQTLFLADMEMEWGLGSQGIYVDLARDGFYGFFPLVGEKRFRLIGSMPEELEDKEEITAGDIQRVLDERSGLRTKITDVHWTSVYRIHRRMTERFRAGRVFLAGDAAHIHSPAGGQGMNTGIGDAYNLGWKLALVVKGHANESLLDSYEAERMPFARAILNGSDRGFSLVQSISGTKLQRRVKLTAIFTFFRLMSLTATFRERAFWFISQLWTNYHESPAVARSSPAKKGPKAGDRAPYGFFEAGPQAGRSLFEVLRGTDHHLLVFEGSKSGSMEIEAVREEAAEILDRYRIPDEVHLITAENLQLHERYGAKEPSLFLIRPDGHIGYRGGASDIVGLRMYLDGLFVRQLSGVEQNIRAQDEARSVGA